MKIISWNVNGIRAVIRKGFNYFLQKEKADVLCLQEIKISDEVRIKENFDFLGYQEFWHSAKRPGYSGTVFLVKDNISVKMKQFLNFDDEGRIQALDLGKFYLVNVYFPNANRELSRLGFKIDFNNKLLKYIKKLDQEKPVILVGDYNVAHNEIDLARPKNNIGKLGFTQEERNWMNEFLQAGFIDTFRYFYLNEIKYSWWSYMAMARQRNVGWRIDYCCVSQRFIKKIKKAFIMNEVQGSDHCPVGIEF